MAHFAEINSDTNKVTRVLVISDSDVENNGGEYTAESEQWVKDNFPNPDGLDVFWKQHKKILQLFANTQINKFDHTGGFMAFISKLIKDNFGISKSIFFCF